LNNFEGARQLLEAGSPDKAGIDVGGALVIHQQGQGGVQS